jgi:ubiquinone/menaquinone biosynthesis C-methylase UbiE
MTQNKRFSAEPVDKEKFTDKNNQAYSTIAKGYDLFIKILPIWRGWICQALPHIRGDRVLEVSFGTGYLLTQYAGKYETYGIDYNDKMVTTAKKNLAARNLAANIQQGTVEELPYEDGFFDTIVNTMAFTGYPDSVKAMSELHRVLKKGGRLVMVDVNYPANNNRLGTWSTKAWAVLGDLIRDMDPLFRQFGFSYSDKEIGGFGSIHLYIAEK